MHKSQAHALICCIQSLNTDFRLQLHLHHTTVGDVHTTEKAHVLATATAAQAAASVLPQVRSSPLQCQRLLAALHLTPEETEQKSACFCLLLVWTRRIQKPHIIIVLEIGGNGLTHPRSLSYSSGFGNSAVRDGTKQFYRLKPGNNSVLQNFLSLKSCGLRSWPQANIVSRKSDKTASVKV